MTSSIRQPRREEDSVEHFLVLAPLDKHETRRHLVYMRAPRMTDLLTNGRHLIFRHSSSSPPIVSVCADARLAQLKYSNNSGDYHTRYPCSCINISEAYYRRQTTRERDNIATSLCHTSLWSQRVHSHALCPNDGRGGKITL